jgi:hypothetical protein
MTEFVLAVLALGTGVFAASAAGKLRSPAAYRDFRAGLRGTRLVPGERLAATAAVLVAAETVCAAALAAALVVTATSAGPGVPLAEAALGATALLTAVLAAGVATVLRRGNAVPCRCFGATSSRPLGAVHLARNACLLALLAAGLGCTPIGHARPAAAGCILAVLTGLLMALLFIRWDDLAAVFAPHHAVAP